MLQFQKEKARQLRKSSTMWFTAIEKDIHNMINGRRFQPLSGLISAFSLLMLVMTCFWIVACDQSGDHSAKQEEKSHLEHAQEAASEVLEVSDAKDHGRPPSQSEVDPNRFDPRTPGMPKYVGRESCAECHETEVHDFANSHHDLAMDVATDETVLADFNNTSFTDPNTNVTTKFFKKDGKFYVNAESPNGKMVDYEVKFVFGVDPLQQYLIEFPGGHVQCLTVCWDVKNKKWYTLYPDEKIPAGDELHWTQPAFNWNYMCASCHSTNMKKNYDENTLSYKTSWSEIDVSCEACHGPAEKHVEWARGLSDLDRAKYAKESAPVAASTLREQLLAEGLKPDVRKEGVENNLGLTVNLKNAGNKTEAQVCARCHARRRELDGGYVPGHKFLDYFLVENLRENLYHQDGQILDEVYVYGSFLQSKMYHAGVKCSHCHNPHSLKLVAQGNALCVRCHEPAKYDGPQHHFHMVKEGQALADSGTQCVDCHMPDKHYMVVDPRRDHSFKVPRPDLTVKLGTPNACNDCHGDKTPKWAADHVAKWHPKDAEQQKTLDAHFALVFERARKSDETAVSDLLRVATDKTMPALIRSTAIFELGRFFPDGPIRQVASELVNDKEPLVRHSVLDIYDTLAQMQGDPRWIGDVQKLLVDPVRAVRAQAARVMARAARAVYAGANAGGTEQEKEIAKAFKVYQDALKEYQDGLSYLADRPGAHLNRAVLFEFQGEMASAEKAYEDALKRQPNFTPALVNLATLYARQGKEADAETILKRAIAASPTVMESHYSLGLLLAGNPQRLGEAAQYLAKAAELAPRDPRVQYNYGLAMQHLGQRVQAERGLKKAAELAPGNLDYLNAVAIFYQQNNDLPKALEYTEKMLEVAPPDPQLKENLMRRVNGLRQQLGMPPLRQ